MPAAFRDLKTPAARLGAPVELRLTLNLSGLASKIVRSAQHKNRRGTETMQPRSSGKALPVENRDFHQWAQVLGDATSDLPDSYRDHFTFIA